MYQASAAFHDAAMADAQARLLMRFADGTFLTGEDVTDIEITYPLNEDTDLTVGKCVSAELRTTVLNYHGLLSGFGFGDCAVSLGTLVGTDAWAMPEGKAAVVYRYGTGGAMAFAAQEAAPYLTVGGGEANAQPPFSPDCLVIVGDTLYAGSEDGAVWAAGIGSDGALTALGGAATWEELSAMTWQQVADKTWGELSLISEIRLPRLAEGGILQSAGLFMANENGVPELVGRMGSHAAVANNGQIQEGIASAVVRTLLDTGLLDYVRSIADSSERTARKDFTLGKPSSTAGRWVSQSLDAYDAVRG